MKPLRLLLGLCAALLALGARAVPIVPTDDAQVVEVLGSGAARAEARRLERALLAEPSNPTLAAQLARRDIEQAREQGDPRLAGQALAALRFWPDPASAPLDVLLMQATVAQYLHDFDRAASRLETLLARDPRQAQAWLTLATVRRVQGRYAASDAACSKLAVFGVALYADACLAENQGLRGDFAGARARLARWLGRPDLDAAARGWLSTTLAELEERAGQPAAAEAAFKASLAAGDDAYTVTDYADFLIARGRPADAWALLVKRPRTDAVLLRLAIAGTEAGRPEAAALAAEMRERIAQAALRPGARDVHAREHSMFALAVDRDPARALALARDNVAQQREPIDLLVLAQAARAAGDAAATREAARLGKDMGLHDRRLDALR